MKTSRISRAQSMLCKEYGRHLMAAIKESRKTVEQLTTVKDQGGAYVTFTIPK